LVAVANAEKVVHKGGHTIEAGLSKRPYFVGFSALVNSLGESPSLSAIDFGQRRSLSKIGVSSNRRFYGGASRWSAVLAYFATVEPALRAKMTCRRTEGA
jgi:hypothetical protein